MPSTIVINQANLVNTDGHNNTFVYKFPNSVQFPHHEIALQSANLYYSWANISSALGNNTFSYTWTVTDAAKVRQVILPTGLYEISTINAYMQYQMIANGDYLINSTGQYVYYAEMVLNTTQYAIQVNTYPVPTALPSGWTAPTNFSGFPTAAISPSMSFPLHFNEIIGFPPVGTQKPQINPTPSGAVNQSYLSTVAPQVQPNPNIFVSISNIANKYSVPSSILYSISPSVAFGQQIVETPPQFSYNKLLAGTYNEMRLQLLDKNFNPIQILDPNMTFILVIRDSNEIMDLLNTVSGSK
jgi:hypothetical protein